MNKLVSILAVTAAAAFTVQAYAASHVGAAPMKASEPAAKASAPAKAASGAKDDKKAEKK